MIRDINLPRVRAVAVLAVAASLGVSCAAGAGDAPGTYVAFARVVAPGVGLIATEASDGRITKLELTRNGGRDWRDITPHRVPFQAEDAVFMGAKQGWFVANDCVSARAFVYRTHNAGRSWRASRVDPTNCAGGSELTLSFSDRSHGWLVRTFENGSFAELDRTSDGGVTWTRVRPMRVLGRVRFRTPSDGWFARSDFASPDTLLETSDGGRSWRFQRIGVPRGWRPGQAFIDVPTFFGVRGVLPVTLVSRHRAAVAFEVTSDAGRTWRVVSVQPVSRDLAAPRGPFARYVPTAIASAKVWWAVSDVAPPRLVVTADGGRHWRSVRAPAFRRAATGTLTATGNASAWLTLTNDAERMRVLATTDGGRSWRTVPLPDG